MARVLIRCFSPSSSSSALHSLSSPHHFTTDIINQCLTRTHLHQIHAHFITSGLAKNPFFGSKLLKLSSQFEDLRYILWVFKNIKNPDVVCFNSLIKGFCFSSVPKKGVTFFFEMVKYYGCGFVNSFTFPLLIGCCGKVGCVRSGEMCHGQVVKYGFGGVVNVGNSLIHMYGCCGEIDSAVQVFDEMMERDTVTWNSIVGGFVKVGDLSGAHLLFDKMPGRNVVSWNVMMGGYLEGGVPGCVLKLFREMVRGGLCGNDVTAVSVLTACGRSARGREGGSLHGWLLRRLRGFSLIMSAALIDMYCKSQKVDVARRVFDRLGKKNLVCWNSMIVGHCLHGVPADGLKLFEDMVSWREWEDGMSLEGRRGLVPDEITFVGVLCACNRAGLLTEGRLYFKRMVEEFRIKPNFAHLWCIANLFASNGLVQEALEIVRKASEFVVDKSSESFVWASLLGSCRFQGDVSLAEKVAKALIEQEPQNEMCYALLFNIYAAAGRWEDAAGVKELWEKEVGGNLPGCRLLDLIDLVHNFRIADGKQATPKVGMMMDALALRLRRPNADLEQTSMSTTECQT